MPIKNSSFREKGGEWVNFFYNYSETLPLAFDDGSKLMMDHINKLSFFIVCLLGTWFSAECQLPDTIKLEQVVISDIRTQDPNERILFDSLDQKTQWSGLLTDVVKNKTGIYLKTYGPGGLSSISAQGTAASQTVVRFGDVPLNSSMNGQADLNLIPLALIEEVSLVSSMMMEYGYGGLGGELHINSHPDWIKGVQAGCAFEAGSFASYKTMASVRGGSEKFQSKTRLVFSKAKNDFLFKNTALYGNPEQQQQHAASMITGGLQELYWKPDAKHQLRFSGLATAALRDIPPTMVSVDQIESQYDRLGIAILQWLFTKNRVRLKTSVNYKREYIRYTNKLISIDDTSKADSWIFLMNFRYSVNSKVKLSAQLESDNQRASADNYAGIHFRTVNGVLVKGEYDPVRFLSLVLALKQDMEGKKVNPFLPAFRFRIIPLKNKKLLLDGSASVNYRLPTFNDLYWVPGGNPDLKSEKSYNTEGKITWTNAWENGEIQLSVNASGYWIYIHNKILWKPYSSAFWSPVNIGTAISKGTETEIIFGFNKSKWHAGFSGNYHFNKTNDASANKDKQLIYIPQHSGNISFHAGYSKYALSYSHHFTGLRFTDSENLHFVDFYSTGEVILNADFKFNHQLLSVYLRIENIWNEQYQDIAWRPMPGRAFFGGIKYDFNNP